MKKTWYTLSVLSFSLQAFCWGPTGHRAIAQLAQKYLSPKARLRIEKILGGHDMAFVSTYADEIRSDARYRRFTPWHYLDIAAGARYDEDHPKPAGDLIQGIRHAIAVLRDPLSSADKKAFFLKLLIHLIGDLHQPLHVGHASDLGGNLIQVKWFGQKSNLHRVWDEDMIEHYGMSYTELANSFPTPDSAALHELQQGSILDWAYESKRIAESQVYPSVKERASLGYRYMYVYFPLLRRQLQKAAYRLAYILNGLYG